MIVRFGSEHTGTTVPFYSLARASHNTDTANDEAACRLIVFSLLVTQYFGPEIRLAMMGCSVCLELRTASWTAFHYSILLFLLSQNMSIRANTRNLLSDLLNKYLPVHGST